jgi:coproporphyrinogen III oxidase-like Fe-S oxidoreductase
VRLIPGKTLMKFDSQLALYNWLYPLKGQEREPGGFRPAYGELDVTGVRSRALYFHIPFCETICTFCTLNRGLGAEGDAAVEQYVQALIKEISIKSELDAISAVPPRTIWFGGGTPSVLTPAQIRRIGQAIHDNFDLSGLEEFAFEMEVKSITAEKCEALRDIGVNKARFGLQTFNQKYRKLFNITASLDQTYHAVETLGRYFPYCSFDILYGMHGQTMDELAGDVQQAVDLGTATCEFYPINHLATQNSLHAGYQAAGLRPLHYVEKMAMTTFIGQYMRAASFKPYCGYGYVRLPDPEAETDFVSNRYSNVYHEHCEGYYDNDLVGFGSSGISQSLDVTIMNDPSRSSYIRNLADGDIKVSVIRADHIPYERGVVLGLPYHGSIRKDRIRWEKIAPDIKSRLAELVGEGLVEERADQYVLTELGWTWYVNMMYYLSPLSEQRQLDDWVDLRSRNKALTDGDRRMIPVSPVSPASAERRAAA